MSDHKSGWLEGPQSSISPFRVELVYQSFPLLPQTCPDQIIVFAEFVTRLCADIGSRCTAARESDDHQAELDKIAEELRSGLETAAGLYTRDIPLDALRGASDVQLLLTVLEMSSRASQALAECLKARGI